MKQKVVLIIGTIMVLFLFLIACGAPLQPQEEKVTIKQVEPSQVVLPDIEQEVQPLEVEGNSEGSFLARIMNQMVAKLKGNAE